MDVRGKLAVDSVFATARAEIKTVSPTASPELKEFWCANKTLRVLSTPTDTKQPDNSLPHAGDEYR